MRIALLALVFLAAAFGSEQSLPGGLSARAEGDSSAGRKVFKQCRNCHSVRQGKFGTFGPNLFQVVGRMAGTAPEHKYSPALAGAGFAWTPERLDRWLTDPQEFLPGAKMKYVLESAVARADVIAYLIAAGKR
ncbi:MAG: c-type cytochrome [Proteobacteria bacterium]|nr:c-type cytochrome [Pseudomonadota bacterium]MDA1356604.1 c-type cytochrome [Pseudomonadota bacterium]